MLWKARKGKNLLQKREGKICFESAGTQMLWKATRIRGTAAILQREEGHIAFKELRASAGVSSVDTTPSRASRQFVIRKFVINSRLLRAGPSWMCSHRKRELFTYHRKE
eukprot:4608879-Pleurochrysis_carterae.AAC.2